MPELAIRALSGFLYVAILIACIYISPTAYHLLILGLGILCMREFKRLLEVRSGLWYFFLIAVLSVQSYYLNPGLDPGWPTVWFSLFFLNICPAIGILLFINLFKTPLLDIDFKKNIGARYITTLFYFIGGFVFLDLIPFHGGGFSSVTALGVFVLVWVNDILAYLTGSRFGRRKLMPKVSPGKTVEGFAGGLLAACAAGVVFYMVTEGFPLFFWVGMAVVICVFGTAGDLVQSGFKRLAGVKDSGSLVPGHGGMYDRLDSLIFAAPFVYLYLVLMG